MSDDTDETAAVLGRIEADLDDVEAALARLHEGTYVTCTSCGRAIADERLRLQPTTRWCGACAPAARDGEPVAGGGALVAPVTPEDRVENGSLPDAQDG
ncbi:MAG: TraR/DksA C4-type zinc finger protein [Acidimicrobiales bacterium]